MSQNELAALDAGVQIITAVELEKLSEKDCWLVHPIHLEDRLPARIGLLDMQVPGTDYYYVRHGEKNGQPIIGVYRANELKRINKKLY